MKEIWKDVDHTSGQYQISSVGNLRKKLNGEYIEVKPHLDSYGYLYVLVKFDNAEKPKHVAIHRLVANAFINNPYNLPIVHHIDENKKNNAVSNLFWCTYGQNNSFSLSARKGNVIKNRVIEQYDLNGKLLASYPSFKAAAEAVGVKNINNSNQISKCCRGIQGRKSAYGYIWRFGVGDPMYPSSIENNKKEHQLLFEKAYRLSPDKVIEALIEIVESADQE